MVSITPAQYTEYSFEYLIKETAKAWHVKIDGINRIVAKSHSKINEIEKKILIENWLAGRIFRGGAIFSDDETRRFVLWRIWDDTQKVALCIGLNPSTANQSEDDPTIKRLSSTLIERGFGGFRMVNLFTHISSKPSALLDPAVQANENADIGIIFGQSLLCQEIIFCWGTFKEASGRAKRVVDFFVDAKCFGKNHDGSPWHPMALMYAGLKPNESQLYKYSEHTFEKNKYNRKKRKKVVEQQIAQIPLIPKPDNQLSLI
jgi:hypothetical protein